MWPKIYLKVLRNVEHKDSKYSVLEIQIRGFIMVDVHVKTAMAYIIVTFILLLFYCLKMSLIWITFLIMQISL